MSLKSTGTKGETRSRCMYSPGRRLRGGYRASSSPAPHQVSRPYLAGPPKATSSRGRMD